MKVERFPQIMPDNSIKENQEEQFMEKGDIEDRWGSWGHSQNRVVLCLAFSYSKNTTSPPIFTESEITYVLIKLQN